MKQLSRECRLKYLTTWAANKSKVPHHYKRFVKLSRALGKELLFANFSGMIVNGRAIRGTIDYGKQDEPQRTI